MSRRGRPHKGAEHVEKVEASAETKTRLTRIVQTLTGEVSVSEACEELGVSESHFHRLRERALTGAAEALEPRPVGRPPAPEPTEPEREVEALRAKVMELEIELRAAQLREELALAIPQVLQPPAGKEDAAEKKKLRNAAKRRRRAQRR